ncbi:tetratricopeptide repeat-containing sulfotransferase family protein [Rhodanobacter ginsengisoli]|uniref:Tetratricopeptide repeat-containing sulfotransferase family protein n=1 Tax=Rhodanobacter ginsengisoli TaxID=418646 RepID=A0ABW0QIM8_9GAMM
MTDALTGAPEPVWLECAQMLILRGDSEATLAVLDAALAQFPASPEVRLALAGIVFQQGSSERAESLLRGVLDDDPDCVAATFQLARLLKEQGRMHAVASVVRAGFQRERHDADLVIRAVELLDDCGRKREAAALCEHEIAAGSGDPRLHAYAGMLLTQLGQFELARKRQEYVLDHDLAGLEWHVPLGLTGLQRYADGSHPDFARLRRYLLLPDLSDQARASLLFGLGKAHDDIGDYAQATGYLRQANTIVHAATRWPRKRWRRSIEARLSRTLPAEQLAAPMDWTPLFIIGLPRSGTTVLAERLARHPEVCQRGELPWLPVLAEQVITGSGEYRERLQRAAVTYAAQLRQDDSSARWMLDKQPHNFMHVDLILALFPNARFLYCRRHARDNALSLWMQSFQAGTQDFAYDFTDIGAVIHGSRRLMKHWLTRYPDAIRTVEYEQLVADPASLLRSVADWLELPPHDLLSGNADSGSIISTASLWQARQPINARSLRRWKNYAAYVPELLQIPDN